MDRLEKTCYNCKFYSYDWSCGAADCGKADDIPEDLFEKHFVNDISGCPFHKEIEEDRYAEYLLKSMEEEREENENG